MDFYQAKKKFDIVQRAYVNGAISLDKFREKVDLELEILDENGDTWKIDEDSGQWLFFSQEEQAWEERKPNGVREQTTEEPELFKVAINPPVSPKVPENIYQDWKNHLDAPVIDDVDVASDTQKHGLAGLIQCAGCGKANKSGANFCIGCGNPIKEQSYCGNCGKPLKPENKFCTGCGTTL